MIDGDDLHILHLAHLALASGSLHQDSYNWISLAMIIYHIANFCCVYIHDP